MSAPEAPCKVHQMAWCALCAPKPAASAPIPRDHGPVVLAQFDGVCACCEEPYLAGQPIVYSETDVGWALATHVQGPVRPGSSTDIDWTGII